MQTNAIQPLGILARPLPPDSPSARDERTLFAGALARAKQSFGTPEARAREGAEQLVATALVMPVLKSLRESNSAAGVFAPSSGEKTFRAIADTALAERLVRRSDWALVDRIAASMSRALTPGATP